MATFHFSWHLPVVLTAGLFLNNALADNSEQQGLCPSLGWSEGLGAVAAASQISTAEPNSDCSFHQWSWEVFIWATAPDPSGNPRFLSLATPGDLLGANQTNKKKPLLTLGTRTHLTDTLQETGAIVQADGNMLIGKNGYPVYASVHMDSNYLATAKQNLVYNGGYANNVQNEVNDFSNPNYYFQSGAAVFKATWLRLGDGVNAPDGSYTTAALVPILTVKNNIVQPKTDDQGNVITTKSERSFGRFTRCRTNRWTS
ncbi:MAG: hypothetical protein NVV73_20095 [Cellvibrionaceae bacterium]|nr:hypothetical protein [Cellvibrionaceae bacterium]